MHDVLPEVLAEVGQEELVESSQATELSRGHGRCGPDSRSTRRSNSVLRSLVQW